MSCQHLCHAGRQNVRLCQSRFLSRPVRAFILHALPVRCLPCDGTTAVNNATVKDCSCVNPLHVLVEASSSGSTLTAKTCIPCPTRTRVFPDNDRYTCASCPDPRMTMSSSGSCVCDADYTAVGRIGLGSTSCVTTTVAAQYTTGSGAKYPETSAEKLVYFNFEQPASSSSEAVTSTQHPFTSLSFAHMYTAAAIRCVQYSSEADASACAVLGHLCALVEYDLKSPVRPLISWSCSPSRL